MTIVGAVGRCRGFAPRSKTSMMIMRPPQHGQLGLLGSTAAAVGSPSGFADGEQLTRACDVVGAGAVGEQAVVADAVEAVGSTWMRNRRMNSPVASVMQLVPIAALGAVVLPLGR